MHYINAIIHHAEKFKVVEKSSWTMDVFSKPYESNKPVDDLKNLKFRMKDAT